MTFEFSEGYEDVEDPPLSDVETDDTEPLLDGSEEIQKQNDKTSTVTIPQLLVSRHLQKPLIIVSFAMLSQQLSGESMLTVFAYSITIIPFRHQRR